MSAATKTCRNCTHRDGSGAYARCDRTQTYISTEFIHGGWCAGKRHSPRAPEMNLWEPRRTIWMRIKSFAERAK